MEGHLAIIYSAMVTEICRSVSYLNLSRKVPRIDKMALWIPLMYFFLTFSLTVPATELRKNPLTCYRRQWSDHAYILYTNVGLLITTFHYIYIYIYIYMTAYPMHIIAVYFIFLLYKNCHLQLFCYFRGSRRGNDRDSTLVECCVVSWRKSSGCCDRLILTIEHSTLPTCQKTRIIALLVAPLSYQKWHS